MGLSDPVAVGVFPVTDGNWDIPDGESIVDDRGRLLERHGDSLYVLAAPLPSGVRYVAHDSSAGGIQMAQVTYRGEPNGIWLDCIDCGRRDRLTGDETRYLPDSAAREAFIERGWTIQPTRCPSCAQPLVLTERQRQVLSGLAAAQADHAAKIRRRRNLLDDAPTPLRPVTAATVAAAVDAAGHHARGRNGHVSAATVAPTLSVLCRRGLVTSLDPAGVFVSAEWAITRAGQAALDWHTKEG